AGKVRGSRMIRKAIVPKSFPFMDTSRYTFSLGIEAGGYAWLSGHTGARYDPSSDSMVLDDTLESQMEDPCAKVEAVLGAGGLSTEAIVRIVEYVPAANLAEHTARASEVRSRLTPGHPQVVVVPVDRLLRGAARIEVAVVALRPGL